MDESQAQTQYRNINRVVNKLTGNEITVTLDKIAHKYSNTKVPIYRFFHDGVVITKNNHYECSYDCLVCGRTQIVALNNILRKINRGIVRCKSCKELVDEKRENQSHFMKNKANRYGKKTAIQIHTPTMLEKLDKDKAMFEDMDSDFKDTYFRRFLTDDEFEHLRPKIIDFQNGKYTISEDMIYYPCVSIHNQARFNPYIYDRSRDTIEKIHSIKFKCENCEEEHVSKDLITYKNKIKILCRNCSLTNNIFKIRKCNNVCNDKITYQSKYELKFIRFMHDNKVVLQNGPKISYQWNGKERTYVVDFFVPKLGLLVELKDNHCWHKEQVSSGKWTVKENAARTLTTNEDPKYKDFKIIFPGNYVETTREIVKSYWEDERKSE